MTPAAHIRAAAAKTPVAPQRGGVVGPGPAHRRYIAAAYTDLQLQIAGPGDRIPETVSQLSIDIQFIQFVHKVVDLSLGQSGGLEYLFIQAERVPCGEELLPDSDILDQGVLGNNHLVYHDLGLAAVPLYGSGPVLLYPGRIPEGLVGPLKRLFQLFRVHLLQGFLHQVK